MSHMYNVPLKPVRPMRWFYESQLIESQQIESTESLKCTENNIKGQARSKEERK